MEQKQIPIIDTRPFELFLDLDGVFADFEGGVVKMFNKPMHEIPRNKMWSYINAHKEGFFYTLELMKDAIHLWDYCKQYDPTVLSGLPSMRTGREQKTLWVHERLTHPTAWVEEKIIVLPKKDKQLYSGPNKVLIDDTPINIDQWNSKGGIGVLHDGDVFKTIAVLEELRAAYAT